MARFPSGKKTNNRSCPAECNAEQGIENSGFRNAAVPVLHSAVWNGLLPAGCQQGNPLKTGRTADEMAKSTARQKKCG